VARLDVISPGLIIEGDDKSVAEKAQSILEISSSLFFENDYNSVGIRAIAHAAGVRGASIYHYFSSKEEILFLIVKEVTSDFIDSSPLVYDEESDFRKVLRMLVSKHIFYFWEHRIALAIGYREMHNLTLEHKKIVQGYRLEYQHSVQRFVSDGVVAGAFQCKDPNLTGVALLDLINGVNDWFRPNGRLSIEQIADQYCDLSQQMLGAQNANDK